MNVSEACSTSAGCTAYSGSHSGVYQSTLKNRLTLSILVDAGLSLDGQLVHLIRSVKDSNNDLDH